MNNGYNKEVSAIIVIQNFICKNEAGMKKFIDYIKPIHAKKITIPFKRIDKKLNENAFLGC